MSFTVTINGLPLFSPGDSNYCISNGIIEEEICTASTFKFTIPVTNPNWEAVGVESQITIYKDFEVYWKGFISYVSVDFFKTKTVTCVNVLGYLARTITGQVEYSTASGNQELSRYIAAAVGNHNLVIGDNDHKIYPEFQGSSENLSCYRGVLNYDVTIEALRQEQEVSNGWAFDVKYTENENRIIIYDWTNNKPRVNQRISFGENLLDYAKINDYSKVYTAVIPLGATIEDEHPEDAPNLDKYVDITSVNSGKNYLVNGPMSDLYGRHFYLMHNNVLTEPSAVKTAGQNWLANNAIAFLNIEVKAIDMKLLGINTSYDELKLGHFTRVVSEPFNLSQEIPIVSRTIDILKPSQSTITLSQKIPKTYTRQVRSGLNAQRT